MTLFGLLKDAPSGVDVLVVDDDTGARTLVCDILFSVGLKAAEAGDGRDGYRKALELRPRLSDRTVAVVEDDPQIRTILVESLQALGHRPVCHEPAQALTNLLAAPPDAVVLDVNLGMVSGLDIYAGLRAQAATRGVPVIICTVHRENTLGRKMQREGRIDDPKVFYLYKPFTFVGLYCTLGAALGVDPRDLPPLPQSP